MRLEERFMKGARPWDGLQSDRFAGGGVCQKQPRSECSGKLRVSRLGSLQLSVSLFPGEDLVWIRPSPPFRSQLCWGGPPVSGRGQVRDHRGDKCTHRKQHTHPGLPGASHLIEQVDCSWWGVSNSGPLALWAEVRGRLQVSHCFLGPGGPSDGWEKLQSCFPVPVLVYFGWAFDSGLGCTCLLLVTRPDFSLPSSNQYLLSTWETLGIDQWNKHKNMKGLQVKEVVRGSTLSKDLKKVRCEFCVGEASSRGSGQPVWKAWGWGCLGCLRNSGLWGQSRVLGWGKGCWWGGAIWGAGCAGLGGHCVLNALGGMGSGWKGWAQQPSF